MQSIKKPQQSGVFEALTVELKGHKRAVDNIVRRLDNQDGDDQIDYLIMSCFALVIQRQVSANLDMMSKFALSWAEAKAEQDDKKAPKGGNPVRSR